MPLTAEQEAEYVRLLEYELEIKQTRNDIFELFRDFFGRYAVLIGGSGSGKSYEIADKIIDRIVHEDGHRILCVRALKNQITESQFPLIIGRIEERYNIDDFKINYANGKEKIVHKLTSNQIIFWGLDDVKKLKSIYDITSIWIEEADQTTEAALNELDRRLRGYKGVNANGTPKYMQIMLSFNPVSVLSWIKKRFFDNKEPGQIMLHGLIPFTDCVDYRAYSCPDLYRKVQSFDEISNRLVEHYYHDTLVIHSTYRDNRFIDDEYHRRLQKLKEADEDEYNIYALGMWGITGGIYFDKHNVNARIQANPTPIAQGYFEYRFNDPDSYDKILGGFEWKELEDGTDERASTTDDENNPYIVWVDDPDGPVKIYEHPKWGHPYVAGGDTAGDGSDYNTAAFTDNSTGADVASLRTLLDEDEYARQMYCLGRYYNDALIGIETNFSTHPVKELQRLGYARQYVRTETPDKYTGKTVERFGFRTDKLTRPLALGMLRTVVREHPELIQDLDTLHEMTTFVKNEKGRPEAAQGAFDDMVLARAINCYIASQQTRTVKEKPKPVPTIRAHKDRLAKASLAHVRRGPFV